jgi:DNA topoisomerase VI subunit B
LGPDRHDVELDESGNGKADDEEFSARIIRFANRVPLLYQQSSCCLFKGVVETKWNNYSVSQSSGAAPRAPMVILIHMASVWVPFISEGKEAIADYDEIRKEVKLAIAECGRRLATLLKRKRKRADYSKRRDVFTRYIDEVVESVRSITTVNKDNFRKALIDLAKTYTVQADMEFDEHGQVIKKPEPMNELGLQDTIIVDREDGKTPSEHLPNLGEVPPKRKRKS